MNTKKSKNKNRPNKPPNPNPPQKVEDETPINKKVQQNSEIIESVSKIEERVPEIICEVLTCEEKIDETPKKPKRNRGKKKNLNTDDEDEVLVKSQENKVEYVALETEDVLDMPDVAPSARKKKNKGKKSSEAINILSEKEAGIALLDEEIKTPETVEVEFKEQILPVGESSLEQEAKPSKKKNKKKKNRNDSEKSDKADELSCVTAFQKLLKDEESETKIESIIIGTSSGERENITTEKNITDVIEVALLEEKVVIPELKKEDTSNMCEPMATESSKGKKKNKKVKKYPPTEEHKELVVDPTPKIEVKSISEDISSQLELNSPLAKEKSAPKESISSENINLDDDNSKSKAKVAKPVERKRKEKLGDQIKDSLSEKTMQGAKILSVEDKSQDFNENIKHEPVEKETKLDEKPKEEKSIQLSEITTTLEEIESKITQPSDVLSITDDEKEKKRKKSPKPKKHHQTAETETPIQSSIIASFSTENIVSEAKTKPEEEDENIKEIKSAVLPTPDTEKGNKSKKSPKPKKKQQTTETDPLQSQTSIVTDIICIENLILEPEVSPEEEKSKDTIEITTSLVEIDPTTVTKSDLLAKIDIDIDTKNKKSLKQKKHPKKVENDLTRVQTGTNVDVFSENISLEMEIKPTEEKSEENIESVSKVIYEETEIKTSESKTKKKRKKSPKLCMEPKIETKSPILEEESNKESLSKENVHLFEGQTDSFCNLPSQDNIEISSLRADESEGSTCGVTPDIIQYPRATSQELIDDNNNNMIIQEITVIEETRLEIPTQIPDTPLICGSGETPLATQEIGVASCEVKIDQPKASEKTDLKSKMMEVNQDMEELRLSIEKSLAELTSIEKNEEELEMELDDNVLVITEESLSMPCEKVDVCWQSVKESKEPVSHDKKTAPISESSEKSTIEHENKEVEVKMISDNILQSASMLTSDKKESTEIITEPILPPVCPARKDHKNKGKSKKKGKQDSCLLASQTESSSTTASSEPTKQERAAKKEEKTEQKSESSNKNSKQQSDIAITTEKDKDKSLTEQELNQEVDEFEPIENFEDAMTSSADDINKSFEMIANDANQMEASHVNPEINIIAPIEDTKQKKRDEKVNPLSQPKNLLGHPDIPVASNRMDYKKEKNKSPNEILAKVKIKDSVEVETKRQSKESQTENIKKFMKNKSIDESFSLVNENDDFVYKYSFRKVFLQSSCHVCKKELKQSRVPCSYCCLVFYCSGKHKDEDWAQHQALCFAVSTIGHLKDQKHIYADAKNVTAQNYRLLRMQMIVSCEKVLKRRLVPWEQEALLYPRICADISCREWRQGKLVDCEGCGQVSYCAEHPDHFPKTHQRWCKTYSLYQKLVSHQQTKGRLEPKLPSKVIMDYGMPENMNEVLASMYEEKIDMSDIQYAALTQLATAPLTAAYCYQLARKLQPHANGTLKKSTCTIHVVDAELQFEADALNKWEVFFLHLTPVDELRVVMISAHLNPGNLPLELLSKIKLCENCRLNNRRVIFNFQDKQTYYEYWAGEDYITPNIVCAFNANITRSSMYSTKDPWPKTINCILKQKVPLLITDHTLNEIHKDFASIKESADHKYNVIVQPKINNFASVRPDRNFISDDEMPLLFKNYCFALLVGVN